MGCWGREGAGALGSASLAESQGGRRESLEGALGETPQFVTGALDRASIWPGRSLDLSTGIGF